MEVDLEVISVAGLTDYIQSLLEDDRILQRVWVTGEVSSLQEHPKGLFFTLSDSDAAIKCVVWGSQKLKLMEKPKRGEQIIVLGSLRVFGKRGEYQLTVVQCLATGEGLQALRYQQLRNRLQAEGLFDLERKRAIPTHPNIVAVVTSSTAAAWGDIQRTLSQRYPGLRVLFSPAIVQGEEAPNSIVQAIERVNRDGRADVIILARGGGAVEDLSCFNDERVVRAIVESTIPIITGIGHQRDESLADLVADYRAHTPTAAAEIAVPSYSQLVLEHQQRVQHLINSLKNRLSEEFEHLEYLKTRLKRFPQTSRQLIQATAKCHLLQQKLIALDPKAVLQRGYAVVRQENNQIIRSTEQVKPEQALSISLNQGTLKVKVVEIIEKS
ncbi:exodeoxyribonuclease VII large subunit [Chroococcus sp. FPU101]|uniref:exodeoxyribonuclease VII large subunit n=1 Tax=Chroococcus sp. FPU101 TaxID=1974212 RepID=UPI001A8F6BF6|nr:exodeoxyribonuclease VII large subunit [Chroococcus sp. FPU101]GFE67725.1 exodeoxyribonuclease VII, large subunit [Chroococcus sp. FPU101]